MGSVESDAQSIARSSANWLGYTSIMRAPIAEIDD